MTSKLIGYMDNVKLEFRFDVNISPKKSWEFMGKSNLVWSPIKIRLDNQYCFHPIGRLEKVEVNIEGVSTREDFEVIDIMDNSYP
jgi:hypothetical protein